MVNSNYWNEQRYSAIHNSDVNVATTVKPGISNIAEIRERLDFCNSIKAARARAKNGNKDVVNDDVFSGKMVTNRESAKSTDECQGTHHDKDESFASGMFEGDVESLAENETGETDMHDLPTLSQFELFAKRSQSNYENLTAAGRKSVAAYTIDGLLKRFEDIARSKSVGDISAPLSHDQYVFTLKNERFSNLKIHLHRISENNWHLRFEGDAISQSELDYLKAKMKKNMNNQNVFFDDVATY